MNEQEMNKLLFSAQVMSLSTNLDSNLLIEVWNEYFLLLKEDTLFYFLRQFCPVKIKEDINTIHNWAIYYINFLNNTLQLNLNENQKLILINDLFYLILCKKDSEDYDNIFKNQELTDQVLLILKDTPEDNSQIYFRALNYEIYLFVLSVCNSQGKASISKYKDYIISLVPKIKEREQDKINYFNKMKNLYKNLNWID